MHPWSRHARHWLACERCPLACKNKALGRGRLPCRVVLIGEAPGETEELTGIVFSGKSGRLLQKAIHESGMTNYFITNTVACRPPGNRKPTDEEMHACLSRFLEVWSLCCIVGHIRPRVVLLGRTAAAWWRTIPHVPNTTQVYEAPHPSFVLRTGGESSRHYKELVKAISGAKREMDYLCSVIAKGVKR